MKQIMIELQGEMDTFLLVGDFNTSLPIIDETGRQNQ